MEDLFIKKKKKKFFFIITSSFGISRITLYDYLKIKRKS